MREKLPVKTGLNSAQAGEAANSVGRSHSSDEVLRKQKIAKGFGYLVRSILEQPRQGVGGG